MSTNIEDQPRLKASLDLDSNNTFYNKDGVLNISYEHNAKEIISSGSSLFTLLFTASKAGD